MIHVLRGTYPISQQLVISTPGLTIRGRAGAMILLQAPVVPFLCNGSDDTIDGLTMTSNAPYPVEFIQIGGDGNQILNCQIYGSAQPGDSSTWVVNRGFVTQGNATNLLVRNNVFHTLRQPAYLNPGSTGTIMGQCRVQHPRLCSGPGDVSVLGAIPGDFRQTQWISRCFRARRPERLTTRFPRCRAATAAPRSAISDKGTTACETRCS